MEKRIPYPMWLKCTGGENPHEEVRWLGYYLYPDKDTMDPKSCWVCGYAGQRLQFIDPVD